jgi:hypothetical protein
MNGTTNKTNPLSIAEYKEFQTLKTKLFGEHKFVCFSKEEKESDDFKKYDAYMARILGCAAAGVPRVAGQPVLM